MTDIVKVDMPDGMAGVGLEDVDASDIIIPRLRIVHAEGEFKDSLSGEQFKTIDVILLGLVKQRLMWDVEVEDDAKPLCKSNDFITGHPGEAFPWEASGFKTGDGDELPCENCALKEWGSHPRNDAPWCAEQHTFPILMMTNGVWAPSIFQVQKTGIKPSKTYISSFARTRTPLFTKVTRLTLATNKRGSVIYSVPSFTAVEDTDSTEWQEYTRQFVSLRDWLQNPPRREEETPVAAPSSKRPSVTGDDEPEF